MEKQEGKEEEEDQDEGELLDRLEEMFTRSELSRNETSRRVEIMKRNLFLYGMRKDLRAETRLAATEDDEDAVVDVDEEPYVSPHESYRSMLDKMSGTIDQSRTFTSRRERAMRMEIANLVRCLKDYDLTNARLEARSMKLEEKRQRVMSRFLRESIGELSLDHLCTCALL